MAYLFSYGTLQESAIQKAVFNRKLKGWPDELPGFELSKSKGYGRYPIVERTGDLTHKISGMVFHVEPDELMKADLYEGDAYKRILIVLASGKKAWLYIGV